MRWPTCTATTILFASSVWAQAPAGWNDLGSEFGDGLLEPWQLAPIAAPSLNALGAVDEVTDELVEALIDALAKTDHPGYGYSSSSDAVCFLPLAEIGQMGATLLPVAPLERNEALGRLEELGPRALPHLLAHLDDARPTRLLFDSANRFGAQRLDRRVNGNPLNEREARALGEWIVERWTSAPSKTSAFLASYELTVGDLCFVALGQIVNRPHYAAVRYWPSGNTKITSPVQDPELAEMLRAAWAGGDPRRVVWESLLLDCRTRGQHTSTLRTGAATRLAYYFPEAAAPILVRLLDEHVGWREWTVRQFQDGLVTDELLKALGACGHPLVTAAWRRALARGSRPPSLGSRFGVVLTPDANEGAWLLDRFLRARKRGEDERAFEALRVSFQHGPDLAAPIAIEALADQDPGRLARSCRLLAHAPGQRDYALAALERLLADRRPGGSAYVMGPEGRFDFELCVTSGKLSLRLPRGFFEDDVTFDSFETVDLEALGLHWDDLGSPTPVFTAGRLPLRVCDEAAIAIACITGRDLDLHTDHAGLDAQVKAWDVGR